MTLTIESARAVHYTDSAGNQCDVTCDGLVYAVTCQHGATLVCERFLYLSSLLDCFPPADASPITDKLMRLYNSTKRQVAT